MAITCGFFNSLEGDRKYDARQMGEMFDGLIMDGVFMSIGDALKTTPSSGMTVAVGTGRAWFLHTWTKNDSEYLIEVSAAESVLNRIDTIVLDVDNTEAVRNNTIKLIKGTPASNAKRPTLINITDHKQIPLADILVPAGATTLTATNITNIVGTSECPYVTGPLSIIQNDDILAAWQEEFDTWFEGVKGSLDEDTAGNLYNLIQQKVDKTSVLDTMDEINLTTEKGLVAGALAIKELNSDMPTFVKLREDNSIVGIKSPHTIKIIGTKIFQGVGDYGQLFSRSELLSMLKTVDPSISSFDSTKCAITSNNGDSSGHHFYQPEWWSGNAAYYQYYYPSVAGLLRSNFCIEYITAH